MAVNELIVSGKWATGTNWSAGEKPKVSHDVLIPAGKEVKIEAAAVCRSLLVEGTVTSTSSLAIGNSEQPNGPAGLNWIWKVAAGAVITGWKTGVELASTFTGAEQKISIDKTLTFAGELKNSSASKGKYLLEEQLNMSGNWATSTGFVLNTNGKLVKINGVEFNGEKLLITLGASEVQVSGSWVAPAGAESTLSAASSTILYTGTKFVGGSLTYGTVILEAGAIEVTGNNTIKTLTLKTAGLAATKFAKGSTQTVEAFKAEGGKTGSLVKMESTEAGKEWKLHKVAGNVNVSFIEVKDSHVDAAPKWYGGTKVTESVFLTGNENWLEEVEPGGEVVFGKATGTLLLGGTATATVRSVVSAKATGPLLLTGTATATLRSVATGKATGALVLSGTSTSTVRSLIAGKATGAILLTGTSAATIRAVVAAKATGTLLLTGTSKGSVAGAVQGKATGALTLTGTSKATVRAVLTGKATGTLLLTGTATGQRVSRVTGTATGTLLFAGSAKGSISGSVTGKATGALLFTGSAHAEPLIAPPHFPGLSEPRQISGLVKPGQLVGVTQESENAGL